MRMADATGCALLLILFAGPVCGQEPPASDPRYGAFAFPDDSGTRLLTTADLPQPSEYGAALCSGGGRFAIRFERRQAKGEGYNGRQTHFTFDKVAGSVFAVLQGKIGSDESCFLAGEALLESAKVLLVERPAAPVDCDIRTRSRVASSRNRAVAACRIIAKLPSERTLVVVEFARQDKDALASLILTSPERMISADFPAEFRGPGQDLWRADDGGELDPGDFNPVFLLQRGESYTLGLAWSAPEGNSLSVLVSGAGDRFTTVIRDYWYWSPL